jgi:hypothetical protein
MNGNSNCSVVSLKGTGRFGEYNGKDVTPRISIFKINYS